MDKIDLQEQKMDKIDLQERLIIALCDVTDIVIEAIKELIALKIGADSVKNRSRKWIK